MVDRLPRITSTVDDGTIPVTQLQLFRHLACNNQQVAQHLLIGGSCMSKRWNLLLRNDHDVGRRLWVDIAKREALIVLIDDIGGRVLC